MVEIFLLFKYLIFQTFGLFIALVAGVLLVVILLNKHYTRKVAVVMSVGFIGVFIFFWVPNGIPQALEYPFQTKTFGPGAGPGIPFKNIATFFLSVGDMERLDIAKDPTDLPDPINRNESKLVKIELEAKEVIGSMADGIEFNYWTFNGTVPGPFLRVREGDTVELTLKNNETSVHWHNIDLHAVTGPGGGATVTNVAPGDSKSFTFKALNPGLYVYHCAHPNVAVHMAHGMYGLILVEPKEGMSKVDKEFYVMQGEFYSGGPLGNKGLQIFDAQKMLDSDPEYIVFNGRTEALAGTMEAEVGDTVRLFVGNGGVNLVSSFHVIGEIFDRVYPEAALGNDLNIFENVQTTIVPAGGATIVEFDFEVPGRYILVDHALARLDRGAWGYIDVTGEENEKVFNAHEDDGHDHDH